MSVVVEKPWVSRQREFHQKAHEQPLWPLYYVAWLLCLIDSRGNADSARVRLLVDRGDLPPCVSIGGKLLFRREAIEKHLADSTVGEGDITARRESVRDAGGSASSGGSGRRPRSERKGAAK